MKCLVCDAFMTQDTLCQECFQDAQDNVKKSESDKAVIEAAFEWARIGELFEFDNLLEAIENHPDYKEAK